MDASGAALVLFIIFSNGCFAYCSNQLLLLLLFLLLSFVLLTEGIIRHPFYRRPRVRLLSRSEYNNCLSVSLCVWHECEIVVVSKLYREWVNESGKSVCLLSWVDSGMVNSIGQHKIPKLVFILPVLVPSGLPSKVLRRRCKDKHTSNIDLFYTHDAKVP